MPSLRRIAHKNLCEESYPFRRFFASVDPWISHANMHVISVPHSLAPYARHAHTTCEQARRVKNTRASSKRMEN